MSSLLFFFLRLRHYISNAHTVQNDCDHILLYLIINMQNPITIPEYLKATVAFITITIYKFPHWPHTCPLLTFSLPVECTIQSASLLCAIAHSSLLCHSLLLLARPLPSPTCDILASSTVLAALTAAVLSCRRMLLTSSPICFGDGGSPRRARVHTQQLASRATMSCTPELSSPYAPNTVS